MIDMVLAQRKEGWNPGPGKELTLMVNNLGGLSVLELDVVADEVLNQLRGGRGLRITRLMVGTFLTSLDGPGFSVTLLELDSEVRGLLDAPASARAWPITVTRLDDSCPASQMVVSMATSSDYVLGDCTDARGQLSCANTSCDKQANPFWPETRIRQRLT